MQRPALLMCYLRIVCFGVKEILSAEPTMALFELERLWQPGVPVATFLERAFLDDQ